MNSYNFIVLNKTQKIASSLTETQETIQNEPLTNPSWQGQTNIEINYWVLLTVPILLIIAFWVEVRKKYLPIKKKESLDSSHFPCYQCKFFNQNPYLKCAVNPSVALTQEASNCKDFSDLG